MKEANHEKCIDSIYKRSLEKSDPQRQKGWSVLGLKKGDRVSVEKVKKFWKWVAHT